jgi:hypothetical protein
MPLNEVQPKVKVPLNAKEIKELRYFDNNIKELLCFFFNKIQIKIEMWR